MVLSGGEVAFDGGEVFVGGHHGGGVEFLGGQWGAQHVDAIQGGLGGDLLDAAGQRQAAVGDRGGEVFGHLVAVDELGRF
jgi:hypothetical protein